MACRAWRLGCPRPFCDTYEMPAIAPMGEQTLPDGARSLFEGPNFATVSSVNLDGSLQASVVWVRTDGDGILFSTVKGRRKHRNMERDPRVSILVVDPADPYVYAEVRAP